jgi:formylmethanofuran dehydrogenase subunit E
MKNLGEFSEDFQRCVQFHGHVCPGLAIGYAAAKAGAAALNLSAAEDEEVVAVVENDSCAVDAVQVLLGCTFGKGNLIFRDWGKQVFTFMDRSTGKAVRVSLRGELPGREERHDLKSRIDSGQATDEERERFDELRREVVLALTSADTRDYFEVREVSVPMPPRAQVVASRPCDSCGEPTMTSRLVERSGKLVCMGCSGNGNS